MKHVPNPQLSVRSARAKELAHQLAKRERRSIAQVVESALEFYEQQRRRESEPKNETAREFYERLIRENHVEGEPDIDLESIIAEHRQPHKPIDL
jgi:hypothetical protein